MTVCTTSFGFNGITNVIMNYFNAFEDSNLAIDFIVINDVDETIKAKIADKSKTFANKSVIYKISGRNKNPIGYIKTLTGILKKGNYDIIHIHGNSATMLTELIAAKKAGVGVRIVHSHNTTCSHKIIHKLAKGSFHKSYTHGFACGEMAGKWLFENREFRVINNGVDANRFTYKADLAKKSKKEFGLEGKKVVGHIGHFSYQKNHEFVLRMFKKLYDKDNSYELVLLGDGKLRTEMEELASQLNIQSAVRFVGRTHKVVEYMHAFDLLILPSRFEGLPLTIIEAVSNAMPCIISDKVSKEAIMEGFVKSLSLDSIDAWVDEIIATDIQHREENSQKAIALVKEKGYDINVNAKELLELYQQFVKDIG